jgi:hypothetical protein
MKDVYDIASVIFTIFIDAANYAKDTNERILQANIIINKLEKAFNPKDDTLQSKSISLSGCF